MRVCRLGANVQRNGNLFTAESFRQELHHLSFATTQLLNVFVTGLLRFLHTLQISAQNLLRDSAGEKRSVVMQSFDGGNQIECRV